MRVVIKEPNKAPEIREISGESEELRSIVGGYIEIVKLYPLLPVWIICDDEGKLKGAEPNFCLLTNDVVCGTVIFVGQKEDDIASLNEDEIDFVLGYCTMFSFKKEEYRCSTND